MTFDELANALDPVANALIVSRSLWDDIKEAAKPADPEWPIDPLAGIRIEVIDDPIERRFLACTMSLETGHPVMFEGENREFFVADMKKADPLFDIPAGCWTPSSRPSEEFLNGST